MQTKRDRMRAAGLPSRIMSAPTLSPPLFPAPSDALTAQEAAMIARAEAEIDAGLGIEDAAFEAWLDALDHDESTPLPPPSGLPAPR